MWEISGVGQSKTFLVFLLLGFFFAVIYDVIKSLRLTVRHGAFSVAAEDICFSLFCALVVFCFFMFTTNGEPRGFAYLAMAIGFICWRKTLSKKAVHFFRLIFSYFRGLILALGCYFSALRGKILQQIQKLLKKLQFWLKKGLKGVKRMVYNLLKRE